MTDLTRCGLSMLCDPCWWPISAITGLGPNRERGRCFWPGPSFFHPSTVSNVATSSRPCFCQGSWRDWKGCFRRSVIRVRRVHVLRVGPPPRGTLSYASDLARRLRERELTVFFTEDEAAVGERLDGALRSALHSSQVVVVVANAETRRDPRWIRGEVDEFRHRHPMRPKGAGQYRRRPARSGCPRQLQRVAGFRRKDLGRRDGAGRARWNRERANGRAAGQRAHASALERAVALGRPRRRCCARDTVGRTRRCDSTGAAERGAGARGTPARDGAPLGHQRRTCCPAFARRAMSGRFSKSLRRMF